MSSFNGNMKAQPGEKVHDFVCRVFKETGKLFMTAAILREAETFHEVFTNGLTEEMEAWILENAQPDSFYYTVQGPMFTPSWSQYQDTSVYWFFDDKETAVIFKLAFSGAQE